MKLKVPLFIFSVLLILHGCSCGDSNSKPLTILMHPQSQTIAEGKGATLSQVKAQYIIDGLRTNHLSARTAPV